MATFAGRGGMVESLAIGQGAQRTVLQRVASGDTANAAPASPKPAAPAVADPTP